MTFDDYWDRRMAFLRALYAQNNVAPPVFSDNERDEAEDAWDAATKAAREWSPMATLEHNHAHDTPLVIDGKNMPATYTSDRVVLTNGKRVWVERSVIMGGAMSSSADKFIAYPSGDKPTHWMPLPEPPEAQ